MITFFNSHNNLCNFNQTLLHNQIVLIVQQVPRKLSHHIPDLDHVVYTVGDHHPGLPGGELNNVALGLVKLQGQDHLSLPVIGV